MPTKQSPTKGTAHSTPTKAKKPGSDQVTPIREAKGKGFFKPEATAMIRHVLQTQSNNADVARTLGISRPHASRLRTLNRARPYTPKGVCVGKKGSHTGY